MKVHLHGDGERVPPELHVMFVAPAAFNPARQEVPAEWVDYENKPVEFQVEFRHGTAEVADDLGKYLVSVGLAEKTRLVVPSMFG